MAYKGTADRLTIWQKFGLFFYNQKRLTTLLWIVLMALGGVSYTTWMRREGFPSVNVAAGFIQIVSFGSSAEQIDSTIVGPIIDNAKTDAGYKDVSASSNDAGAFISLSYKDGTDVAASLKRVEEYAKTVLPPTAKAFYVKFEGGRITQKGDDMLVSVFGNDMSADKLDESSEKVARYLTEHLTMAERVTASKLVETGVNPVTGESVSGQVTFDRYAGIDTNRQVLPAATVAIRGIEGVDQLKLYDEIEHALKTEEFKKLGVGAAISADFAEGIREQVSSLQRNLLEGLVVVLIVSFVLISLRASIITALAMTTTVAVTVLSLHAIGYTLNTITLFSLVLCLALIVDDTTIVVEAIDKGLKEGRALKEVVRDSLKKVARASAAGTLTTVLAFAPMLFIGGVLGKFIRAIPVTIIISLCVSLVVSFVFIPLMMKFSGAKSQKRKFQGVDKIEHAIGDGLAKFLVWSGRTVKRSVAARVASVVVALGFIAGGVVTFGKVEFNIFPAPKNGNEIIVSAQVIDRANATIEDTMSRADLVMEEVRAVLGDDLVELSMSGQAGEADARGFSSIVRLTPINSRDATSVELARQIQARLDAKDTGLRVTAEAAGVGPPAGGFAVQIKDNGSESVRTLAGDIEAYLKTTTLTRIDGTTASFKDVTVTPPNQIVRSAESRIVTVGAGFTAKDTTTLVTLGQDAVKDTFTDKLESQYGLSKDTLTFNFGQEEENQDSFASMGQAAGPLFVGMFLLIALLFRSLLQPLLIFTALPFAFFGVAQGLYWTKNPISFFSMLGVFALIGISLNNTILLTDYANQAAKEGKKPIDAMASALRERLRPLLTTSITSIFALLPLALNDPFWEGLAYTLIFGLISSTILVICVFPHFYIIHSWISRDLRFAYRKVFKRA
jgi:multidrug efflux pump subunit AcrB